MGLFGGIASAVGSIAGGLIGANAQSSANQANIEAAQLANDQAYKRQKEFAQNGIRWKVADAKAAGLHPLAALGVSSASYSPSGMVGTTSSTDYSWLSDAGQSIGRAVEAGLTQKERAQMQALREQSNQLDLQQKQAQLDNMNLQNQALKMDMVRQLAGDAERSYIHQQLGPAFPGSTNLIDGQGDAYYPDGKTVNKPSEVVSTNIGDPSTQSGMPPDSRVYSTPTGRAVHPTEELSEALESTPLGLGYLNWFWRNHVRPFIGNFYPIDDPRRKDGEYFNLLAGEYQKGRRVRDYLGY